MSATARDIGRSAFALTERRAIVVVVPCHAVARRVSTLLISRHADLLFSGDSEGTHSVSQYTEWVRIAAFLVLASGLLAQDPAGHWQGTLDVGAARLRLAIH